MKTFTLCCKRTMLFCLVLFCQFIIVAAPIRNYPITITQPDGQVINCFVSGDEFYHWMHDANDFTIVYNPDNGWYSYASITDGKLVPTNYLVGKEEPSKVGLIPGINPSKEFIQNLRNQRISHLKRQPALTNTPNKGTLNKITVFVRFSDETEFEDSISKYERIYNDTSGNIKSLCAFFKEASYGKLLMKTHFFPKPENEMVVSYQDIQPRGYYQPISTLNPIGYKNNFDSCLTRANELIFHVTDFLKGLIPDTLNLDYNNDGEIDNISLLFDGIHDNQWSWNTILWESAYNFFDYSGITLQINNKRVNWVEWLFQESILAVGCGDVAHETFHTLGSPDMYHYTYNGIHPVGRWDIMGNDSEYFPQLSVFTKFRYGKWIDTIPLIDESGIYSLKSLVSNKNNCYRINSPYSTTEYFVLEYRKKIGCFESVLPGSGLLVYRVNTLADGQGNGYYPNPPDELYLFRPGGSTSSNGNPNSANLNETRNSINDTTLTRCFLANGQPGGLDISNIHEEGDSIVFNVTIVASSVEQSQITENKLNLFPNPGTNQIQFNFPTTTKHPCQLQLHDFTGRQVLSQTLPPLQQSETVTINLSNQPVGIYLVRLKVGGEEFSGKVLLVK